MTFILFFLTLAAIWFSLRLITWRRKRIQTRWEGGTRHIVASVTGLTALAITVCLMLLLDLLERDQFSWDAFVNILQISAILFAMGIFLLAIALHFSTK